MTARPSYLWPLSRPRQSLDAAFAEAVRVFADHPVPSHLCQQCYTPDRGQRVISAARDVSAGKDPDTGDYGQIYFEHPHCSGGEDTIKLFTPFALRDLLTGMPPRGFPRLCSCEVVETMVRAGFWFWPQDQQAAVREIALCLFRDWFGEGRYAWPMPDYPPRNTVGPGLDILSLCTLCLIDPYEIVRDLRTRHGPQADGALAGPLFFSVDPCVYVARDASPGPTAYQDATTAIARTLAAREATAFLTYVTVDWTDSAFFRNESRAPHLAKALSDFGRYYEINVVTTREAALRPLLAVWPTLDEIG